MNQKVIEMKDGCPKIAPMEIIPLIEVEGIHSKTRCAWLYWLSSAALSCQTARPKASYQQNLLPRCANEQWLAPLASSTTEPAYHPSWRESRAAPAPHPSPEPRSSRS